MGPGSGFLSRIDIGHFIKTAEADQPPMRLSQLHVFPLFTEDGLLQCLYLGHVIDSRDKLLLFNALVDLLEEFVIEVAASVYPTEVSEKVLHLHLLLNLQVWRVQVSVEQNDGKGQRDDGVL